MQSLIEKGLRYFAFGVVAIGLVTACAKKDREAVRRGGSPDQAKAAVSEAICKAKTDGKVLLSLDKKSCVKSCGDRQKKSKTQSICICDDDHKVKSGKCVKKDGAELKKEKAAKDKCEEAGKTFDQEEEGEKCLSNFQAAEKRGCTDTDEEWNAKTKECETKKTIAEKSQKEETSQSSRNLEKVRAIQVDEKLQASIKAARANVVVRTDATKELGEIKLGLLHLNIEMATDGDSPSVSKTLRLEQKTGTDFMTVADGFVGTSQATDSDEGLEFLTVEMICIEKDCLKLAFVFSAVERKVVLFGSRTAVEDMSETLKELSLSRDEDGRETIPTLD